MSALVIDGKALAQEIQEALKQEVKQVENGLGRAPRLAVMLVGDNPASQVYVASKTKKAHECGIDVVDVKLPATTSDQELKSRLDELSADKNLDGILLQLPLPKGLNEFEALLAINPKMDVDGLHPMTQGLLLRSEHCFVPCTPKGCIALIEKARQQLGQPKSLAGLRAVVVGRSILVGKPVGLLLLDKNCTVTYCHSKTADLQSVCREADILISAIGKPGFITKEFVKPGAIVIDVGTTKLPNGKLSGDVVFKEVSEVAGAITPVPGGVGPMTITMLLANTVQSARDKIGVI